MVFGRRWHSDLECHLFYARCTQVFVDREKQMVLFVERSSVPLPPTYPFPNCELIQCYREVHRYSTRIRFFVNLTLRHTDVLHPRPQQVGLS